MFTGNRCKANPVLWSEQVVKDGVVRAVFLNSGGANCYTGPDGFQTTHAVAERVAERLGIGAIDVLVCSTGLIGLANPREQVLAGADAAYDALAGSGGDDAAHAIMTTDSVSKQVVVEGAGWTVGGMAKGAGMLAPQLATMLVVLTTDAVASPEDLDTALRAATRVSFDRLDSDGCMSTNDTVALLASGASGITPSAARPHRGPHPRLHRPRDAAARRRRGCRPRDRDHRPGRGQRGRRRRGRTQHRAQQPLQGRGLRQRPELGPRARLDRHDRVRPSTPPTSTSR